MAPPSTPVVLGVGTRVDKVEEHYRSGICAFSEVLAGSRGSMAGFSSVSPLANDMYLGYARQLLLAPTRQITDRARLSASYVRVAHPVPGDPSDMNSPTRRRPASVIRIPFLYGNSEGEYLFLLSRVLPDLGVREMCALKLRLSVVRYRGPCVRYRRVLLSPPWLLCRGVGGVHRNLSQKRPMRAVPPLS